MTAARRHRASRSETPIVGAEGEPGHKQTPSLTTSPSLPLADRTRTIRMMAQAPLGASAPSCFIGTPFISCDSHFSHRRFSRTVIATSRIPTSPINAQSPPAVHILLYNARIVGKRSSCTYTVPRDSHTIPHFVGIPTFPGTPSVYNSGRNRFQRLLYRFRPVQRAHYAISRELYTHRRRNPARFLRCIPFACRTAPGTQ